MLYGEDCGASGPPLVTRIALMPVSPRSEEPPLGIAEALFGMGPTLAPAARAELGGVGCAILVSIDVAKSAVRGAAPCAECYDLRTGRALPFELLSDA